MSRDPEERTPDTREAGSSTGSPDAGVSPEATENERPRWGLAAVEEWPDGRLPPVAAPDACAVDAAMPSPMDTEREEAAAVPSISFGFNLGKVPGKGEDSDPIVRDGRNLGLVGVFDGMGGAGGTAYQTPDGEHTGAYIASRVARDVVEGRMLDLLDPEWNLDGPAAAEDIRRCVRDALVARLAELKAPRSGLRSKLLRALPTTMALAALQRRDPSGDVWACHILWSGDSRAYVLQPSTGAHQLSTDDIRDRGDAMANLREDSVVSNAMSADTDFVVHHRMIELTAPFIVVAATDGCFGYVRSPMHFERMMLTTLRDSSTTALWSQALQEEIMAVTGDDAAMAVLGVGSDHQGFQRSFGERASLLDERWVAPIDALATDIERAEHVLDDARRRQVARTAELWGAYKTDYERYLGDSPAAVEVAP